MPDDVRRYVFRGQPRTVMHRARNSFLQDVVDAIAGQLLAAVVGEQQRRRLRILLAYPFPERVGCSGP